MNLSVRSSSLSHLGWVLAGVLSLGTLLDAFSNALTLVGPSVTIGGTLLIVMAEVAAPWLLRYHEVSLVDAAGARVRLTRLRPANHAFALGCILLLWFPRLHPLGGGSTSVQQNSPAAELNPQPSVTTVTKPISPSTGRVPSRTAGVENNFRPVGAEAPMSPARKLQQMYLEARLTCDLKPGVAIPPEEVEFTPVGAGAHVLIEAPGGNSRLVFVSPVRFRRVDPNRVVTINRFQLAPDSPLMAAPYGVLGTIADVKVPIVTVVYGSSFQRIRQLELALYCNDDPVRYRAYTYDAEFRPGPTFTVPWKHLFK